MKATMKATMKAKLYNYLLLSCLIYPAISESLWPIPSSLELSGSPYPVSRALSFNTTSKSTVLERAITRYLKYVNINNGPQDTVQGMLKVVVIDVDSDVESLGLETSYKYSIAFNSSDTLVISAESPYGAMYGLETLSQLVVHGALINSQITIKDEPGYRHRGLMLDTGRRFIPVELMYNILDGMSFVKLNVLHFHMSDMCRFSVESKKYPDLRNKEQEIYTQDDVKSLVAYARDRGIRVMPEVDSATHVNGLIGLYNKSQGVKFCNSSGILQLYNDPQGVTMTTMKGILGEMMSLFSDQFFHLGMDETFTTSECTIDNVKTLESSLLKFVALNRTSVTWEEALFSSKTALNDTVVQAWKSASIKAIVGTKRYAINSLSDHFYLNYMKVTPSTLWTDISTGLTTAEKSFLLGGEMAMWTDDYCYIDECFKASSKPQGWWMYEPNQDAQFTQSISGLIWPRAAVGAGSFWNYKQQLDATSADFLLRYTAINKRLQDRGVLCCPVGCSCDYLSRCGEPYIQVPAVNSRERTATLGFWWLLFAFCGYFSLG